MKNEQNKHERLKNAPLKHDASDHERSRRQRYILLADMNSFFASCHQSEDPSLLGKPVIVGGSPSNKRKGMVIAASYEARNKGVYTTMSMYEAMKKCPSAIVVQRNHPLYGQYSAKIMDFLRLIGPTEVASIDEAYVDITKRVEKGETPKQIASYIQRTLWTKITIPCSIGIGPTRIIAKMAAEVKKPKGYVQLGYTQYKTYFYPRPVHWLHGCGTKTAEKLERHGITTIGQLAESDDMTLRMVLGKRGEFLRLAAQGISSDKVNSDRRKGDKSIGKETTFAEDVTDEAYIADIAKQMVNRLAQRIKEKRLRAKTVSIVYKKEVGDKSMSRSMTLVEATQDEDTIYDVAINLFEEHLRDVPIRLFGVRLSNFDDMEYVQLSFKDLNIF